MSASAAERTHSSSRRGNRIGILTGMLVVLLSRMACCSSVFCEQLQQFAQFGFNGRLQVCPVWRCSWNLIGSCLVCLSGLVRFPGCCAASHALAVSVGHPRSCYEALCPEGSEVSVWKALPRAPHAWEACDRRSREGPLVRLTPRWTGGLRARSSCVQLGVKSCFALLDVSVWTWCDQKACCPFRPWSNVATIQ